MRGIWSRGLVVTVAVFVSAGVLLGTSGAANASPELAPASGPVPALEAFSGGMDDSSPHQLEALRNPAPTRSADSRSGLCGGTQVNGGCWADGVSRQLTPAHCNTFAPGLGLETAYVGYWIADDGGFPATGDRYWGHVVANYSVLACLSVASIEALLPPKTEFALDGSLPNADGKIQCFLSYAGLSGIRVTYDFTGTNTNNDDCYTKPGNGLAGSTLGYATMSTTLDEWTILEIIFPMRTKAPLFGIASSKDKLGSRVAFTYDELFPDTWVTVQKSSINLAARRKGSKVVVSGRLDPASSVRSFIARKASGPRVSLSFRGRKGGRVVDLGTKAVSPSPSGKLSASFPRRARTTRCEVVANWAGVTTAKRAVSC